MIPLVVIFIIAFAIFLTFASIELWRDSYCPLDVGAAILITTLTGAMWALGIAGICKLFGG